MPSAFLTWLVLQLRAKGCWEKVFFPRRWEGSSSFQAGDESIELPNRSTSALVRPLRKETFIVTSMGASPENIQCRKRRT